MTRFLVPAVVVFAAAGWAGDKATPTGPPSGQAFDKTLKLEATAYLDKASVAQAAGGALDEGVVVIEVKLTPASGQSLNINRDDFLLRSDRDGQRSTPYSPSQVAGSSVMRINTRYSSGGVMADDRGPAWGGIGGGRPSRMPGNQPSVGNTASVEQAAAAIDQDAGKGRQDPVLESLKKKILEEKETGEPIAGQLYFLLEGKQKLKDLELLYKTAAGTRLSVRFK
jgi:hypothetical protein